MRLRALSASLALVMLGSACFGEGHRDPSILQVTALTGDVRVRAPGATAWETLEKDKTLAAGAAVRVAKGGDVTLARGDRSTIELRPSEELAELVVGATAGDITLNDGDALVTTDPSAPISVVSQGTSARADQGIFRFDRRLRVRVGAYSGDVEVTVETGELPSLPPLDEWLVNPRISPVRQPYTLDPTDPWDKRLLPDAVEIEEALLPLAAGYEAQFGRRTKDIVELEPIREDAGLAGLRFLQSSLATASSSDVLVGFVLAVLSARARKADVERTYRSIMSRRRDGASWGLIAHEHSLAAREVLNAVTCVISLRSGEAQTGERCLGPATAPSPTQTATQRPTTGPPPSRRPTTQPSSPRPSPSPTRTTKPPPPPPTPTPTPTCSDIDRLLGRC